MEEEVDYYGNLKFRRREGKNDIFYSNVSFSNNFQVELLRAGKKHSLIILQGGSSKGLKNTLFIMIPFILGLTPEKINNIISFIKSCGSDVSKTYAKFVIRSICRSMEKGRTI